MLRFVMASLDTKKYLRVVSDDEHDGVGRRCVLATIGVATLVGCFGGDDSDAGDASTDDASNSDASDETVDCSGTPGKNVGAVTSFPVGKWKLTQNLIVSQDANGLFAFSAICTHQGCLLNPPSSNGSSGGGFDHEDSALEDEIPF